MYLNRIRAKTVSLVISLFVASLLSGCIALHRGDFVSSVQLSSNNFHYVARGVTGKVRMYYFPPFGGMLTDAMVAEAKDELMKKGKLSAKQSLANVSVDLKSAVWIIFGIVDCVVTADIIEFN